MHFLMISQLCWYQWESNLFFFVKGENKNHNTMFSTDELMSFPFMLDSFSFRVSPSGFTISGLSLFKNQNARMQKVSCSWWASFHWELICCHSIIYTGVSDNSFVLLCVFSPDLLLLACFSWAQHDNTLLRHFYLQSRTDFRVV